MKLPGSDFKRNQRPSKLSGKKVNLDIKDTVQCMATNLRKCGFTKSDAEMVAEYFTAAVLVRLPVLLCGSNTVSVVNAFSASVCGRVPAIIEFKPGFDNYSALITAIKEQDSEVVVFSNAVGHLPESLYCRLSEDMPDRYFMLISNDPDLLHYLPSDFMSYIGIINCDNFIRKQLRDTSPFEVSKNSYIVNSASYSRKECISVMEEIKKISSLLGLNNGYSIKRSQLLLSFSKLSSRSRGLELLIPELTSYSSLNGNLSHFRENLKDINESYLEISMRVIP